MTFTYPAVFTKKEDGTGFHAFFPDLEMCEADGADLEDAIENARDAAQNWISVELEEFEGDLPFATHVDDIELAENHTQAFVITGILVSSDKFIDRDYAKVVRRYLRMAEVFQILEEEIMRN